MSLSKPRQISKPLTWELFIVSPMISMFRRQIDPFYICQQMLAIAILLLQATTTRSQESLQAVFEIANNSILIDETPFCERRSDSLTSCSLQCIRNKRCKSANFIKSEEICSLMDKTRRSHPLLFQKQVNTVHLHKVW